MIRPATAKWWLIWPGSSSSMEWPHDVCMRGLCNSSQGPRILDYKNHGSLCSSPSLVTRHILRTQRTHLSVVMSSSVTPRLRWWCGRYKQSIDTHRSMCSFQVRPCLSDFYSLIVKFRWWSTDKVILLDRWFLHHNIRSLTFQDLIPYSKTTMIRTLFTLASIPSVTRSGWLRKFLFHYSLTKSPISFITGLSIQHSWRLAKCSLPCNYRKGQKLLWYALWVMRSYSF